MRIYSFIKDVVLEWKNDRVPERSATLAFYGLLSVVPLALLTLTLTPLFVTGDFFESKLLAFAVEVFGSESSSFFERVISNIGLLKGEIIYSILAIFFLFYGVSKLFATLRRDIREIFKIRTKSKNSGIKGVIKERGQGLVFMGVLFVLALIFLSANVLLGVAIQALAITIPISNFILHLTSTVVTLLVVGGLYAVVFYVGSEKNISWRHALSGGGVSSLAFLFLNSLFTFYLGSSIFLSVFGQATFILALLLWIYYGAQVLLIGAEVAKVSKKRSL